MNSKNDLFVPRKSVKKLVIKPKSPGHQTNGIEARTVSRAGLQGINIRIMTVLPMVFVMQMKKSLFI